MEFLTPELVKELIRAPIMLAILALLWSMQKTNVRLVEVIKQLIDGDD